MRSLQLIASHCEREKEREKRVVEGSREVEARAVLDGETQLLFKNGLAGIIRQFEAGSREQQEQRHSAVS